MSALYFVLFSSFLLGVSTLKQPSYTPVPCSRNDPKLGECIVKQGQGAISHFLHGDPKYKVPALDPMDIQELKLRQGTRQVGMNLSLKNCKLYGLSHARFTGARGDLKKRHIEWDLTNDYGLQILGDYNISGQVLVLPITGVGKANITIGSLTATYKYNFDLEKRKNKEYMVVKTQEFFFNPSKMEFKLDNLFNGDKLLGDNMNRFLNENWRELLKEFGPAIEEVLGDVLRRLLRSILAAVPYDQFYPKTV